METADNNKHLITVLDLSMAKPGENNYLLPIGTIVKERWKVIAKIGGGGFGEIYRVKDLRNNEVICSIRSAIQLDIIINKKFILGLCFKS